MSEVIQIKMSKLQALVQVERVIDALRVVDDAAEQIAKYVEENGEDDNGKTSRVLNSSGEALESAIKLRMWMEDWEDHGHGIPQEE